MTDIANTDVKTPDVAPDVENKVGMTAPPITPSDYVKKIFNKTGVKVNETDPLIPLLIEIDELSKKNDTILHRINEALERLEKIQARLDDIQSVQEKANLKLSTFMTMVVCVLVVLFVGTSVALAFMFMGV